MRIALWPRSLLGRLIAASVLAVLVAELTAFALIARERETFVLQGNVREWTRRVAEITFLLQPLTASEREAAITRLMEQPRRFARTPGGAGARRIQRQLPPRLQCQSSSLRLQCAIARRPGRPGPRHGRGNPSSRWSSPSRSHMPIPPRAARRCCGGFPGSLLGLVLRPGRDGALTAGSPAWL